MVKGVNKYAFGAAGAFAIAIARFEVDGGGLISSPYVNAWVSESAALEDPFALNFTGPVSPHCYGGPLALAGISCPLRNTIVDHFIGFGFDL